MKAQRRLNGRWVYDRLAARWINLGLRPKIGVLVTAGTLGIVVGFLLLGTSQMRDATDQVLEQRLLVAQMEANYLDTALASIQEMLSLAIEAADPQEAVHDPVLAQAALARMYPFLQPVAQTLYLLDRQGQVVTAEPLPLSPLEDVASAPGVAEALQQGGFSFSSPSQQEPAMLAVAPLHDPEDEGQIVGAVVASVDLSRLLSRSALPHEKDSTLDVVDTAGFVIFSTDPSRFFQSMDYQGHLADLILAGQPAAGPCHSCHATGQAGGRQDRVMAFAPLSAVPWGVVIHQDAQVAFAPVQRFAGRTLVIGGVMLAGALGLMWLTTRGVIDPLQLLTGAARRIAGGDLDTPICCERGDEIGELAETFDEMRLQLRRVMGEYQALNRELDARIQEQIQEVRAMHTEAKRARDELQAIINGLSDELIVVGRNERIQMVNRAARERWRDLGDLVGQPCYIVFDVDYPCESLDYPCPVPIVVETGKAVRVSYFDPNGQEGQGRYVDIMASPLRGPDGQVQAVVELLRDMTEAHQLEEVLVRRNEQLSALNKIAVTLSQSLDLEKILSAALAEVLKLAHLDAGAIFLKGESLGALELVAHQGLSVEAANLAARLGLLDGACGGVLDLGQLVVVPDIRRYGGERAESLRREKLLTLIHVPLISKGIVLGSLCAGTSYRRELCAEEKDFLTAIGHQIAGAVDNARLYAEVRRKEQLRRNLLDKIIQAQEDERKRIARELHDETCQTLTALLYAAEEATEAPTISEAKATLGFMRQMAQGTLDEVYELISDLRPTMLDHLGLVPAIRWFAESRLEANGTRVRLEVAPDPPPRVPSGIETALFRVVQEAITNIQRHAAARNVCISLDFSGPEIKIQIADDGVGFDLAELSDATGSKRGWGLIGMSERVELVGGSLVIDATPREGTQVLIRLPLPQQEAAHAEHSDA
jgi:signal transduction histidine kinase/HAMP domain-containing protein